MKKLYRSRTNKKVGGVCGGIAEYFNLDPSLIRLGAVILIFIWGAGLLAYIAAWAIIPERPTHIDVEYEINSEVFEQEDENDQTTESNKSDDYD